MLFIRLFCLCLIATSLQATDHTHTAHSPAPQPQPEATPETDKDTALYDAGKHLDVEPAEVFDIITELQNVWEVDNIEARDIDHKLRQAQIAAKSNDFDLAEKLFIEALNRRLTKQERYWALLQMAAMYQRAGEQLHNEEQKEAFVQIFGSRELLRDQLGTTVGNLVKATSVYEKFVGLFEHDELIPFVDLQLGRLYRKMGAMDLSLNRFYDVINSSLNIRPANIPAYKDAVREAKKEIAENYFITGNYHKAIDYFSRLQLVELDSDERQEAVFKAAYSYYMVEDYLPARQQLEQLLQDFPESILAPESHYLLANIYTLQHQPQQAVDAVLTLLEHPGVKSPQDERIWLYWQKKAANELANEFYEQGDFVSALRIYQAMWDLDVTPAWRAPVMYQIGLTFAHLEAPQKAIEAFDVVVKGDFWDQNKEPKAFAEYNGQALGEDVTTLQELARWHAQHIMWDIKSSSRIQRLLDLSEEGS